MVVDMQTFSLCVRILANGFPLFFRTCSRMTLHVVNPSGDLSGFCSCSEVLEGSRL